MERNTMYYQLKQKKNNADMFSKLYKYLGRAILATSKKESNKANSSTSMAERNVEIFRSKMFDRAARRYLRKARDEQQKARILSKKLAQ